MRVAIAGMGSALGTAVGLALSADERVTAIAGFDLEPPRRWIRDAEFNFVRPHEASRVRQILDDFAPTVVVHAWVFEPRARSSPGQALSRTVAGTESLLSAVEACGTVSRIVARSSSAIYGTRRAGETTAVGMALRPTTTFGRMALRVELRVEEAAAEIDAELVALRFAPIMASHLPNPLGRYLRLPAVPVPLTTRTVGVIHLDDAAAVTAAAVLADHVGPLNVVAPEPITLLQALTIGRRIAVPVPAAAIRLGRPLLDLVASPVPEHLLELMARGEAVAPSDLAGLVGVEPQLTSTDVFTDLYNVGELLELDELSPLASGAR